MAAFEMLRILSYRRLFPVTVALLLWGIAFLPPAAASAPYPASRTAPHPAERTPGDTILNYDANLYLSTPAPGGSLPFGAQIGTQYELAVPNHPVTGSSDYIVIPTGVLVLPVSTGVAQLVLPTVNVSVHSSDSQYVAVGQLVRVPTQENLSGPQTAIVSSQGLAVTASWTIGAYSVLVRWHWTIVTPDGTRTNGSWSPWAIVKPAAIVALVGSVPKTMTRGAPFSLCLGGALANRVFSLHLSIGHNGSQVDLGATTVPMHTPLPYCWTTTLTTTVASQSAFLHVWDTTSNTSYLLFVLRVQVQDPSAVLSSGPARSPLDGSALTALPVAAVIAVAVALVAVAAVLLIRKRGSPEPRTVASGSAPAGSDPRIPTPSVVSPPSGVTVRSGPTTPTDGRSPR